jgi:hypothetical protein
MTFVPNRRPQSTAARRPQPAAHALLVLLLLGVLASPWATPARAQQTATVRRDGEPFLADSGGIRLGRLAAGATVAAGASQGGLTAATVDGWIIGTAVRPTQRDGHDLIVSRDENLRTTPNGRLVARLARNALVDQVERRGAWVHVRRSGVAPTAGLVPAPAAVAASPAQADSADTSAGAGVVVLRGRVQLYRRPDAPPVGVLEAGSPVRVTGRAGQWVRVDASGWVKASDVRGAGADTVSGVTAADLRNDPDAWKGKVLRWAIQFIALQTADELRPDFTPGQRYILARGPAPEYAFVYIVVPPERLAAVSRLQPLDSLTVLARVVTGRSAYLANPILELVDIVP